MKKFLLFAIFVVINSSLFAFSAKVLNLNEFKAKFYNGNVASPGFKKVTTRTILHIYADWCAPCKAIAPVLEDLSNEYAGKVKIVKVDVTACEDTAVKYNIRNIPALLMFKNGEVVAQQVGAAPRSKLAAFIDQNI